MLFQTHLQVPLTATAACAAVSDTLAQFMEDYGSSDEDKPAAIRPKDKHATGVQKEIPSNLKGGGSVFLGTEITDCQEARRCPIFRHLTVMGRVGWEFRTVSTATWQRGGEFNTNGIHFSVARAALSQFLAPVILSGLQGASRNFNEYFLLHLWRHKKLPHGGRRIFPHAHVRSRCSSESAWNGVVCRLSGKGPAGLWRCSDLVHLASRRWMQDGWFTFLGA